MRKMKAVSLLLLISLVFSIIPSCTMIQSKSNSHVRLEGYNDGWTVQTIIDDAPMDTGRQVLMQVQYNPLLVSLRDKEMISFSLGTSKASVIYSFNSKTNESFPAERVKRVDETRFEVSFLYDELFGDQELSEYENDSYNGVVAIINTDVTINLQLIDVKS